MLPIQTIAAVHTCPSLARAAGTSLPRIIPRLNIQDMARKTLLDEDLVTGPTLVAIHEAARGQEVVAKQVTIDPLAVRHLLRQTTIIIIEATRLRIQLAHDLDPGLRLATCNSVTSMLVQV